MEVRKFATGPEVDAENSKRMRDNSILIEFDEIDDGEHLLIQVANNNCTPEMVLMGAVALLENMILLAKEDGIPELIVKGLIAKALMGSSLYGHLQNERGNHRGD